MKATLKKIFVTSFFGWDNWRYLSTQLILILSGKPSLFSQKRIQMNIAFYAGIGIILCHVWQARHTITNYEIIADATILFTVAGYNLSQIQKEKQNNNLNPDQEQKAP